MKEGDKHPPEIKMRSERRAAKVASTKIAESAKYLASNKIIATTGLPPASTSKTPKAKPQPKTVPASARIPIVAKTVPMSAKIPIAAKPSMSNLPKMPILVFNSLGSSVPTLIPIPSSSLGSGSIVTITPSMQTASSAPKAESVLKTYTSAAPAAISSKFLKYTNATRQNIGLMMECEEECLSPLQWAKYRKAENEYMDMLRKLTKWKSRADAEIVYLEPGDPIPAAPRFLTVQEASRLPVPTGSGADVQDVFVEDTVQVQQQQPVLVPVSSSSKDKDGTATSGALKMIVSPRLNLVMTPTLKLQGQTTTTITSTNVTARPSTKVLGENSREVSIFRKKPETPSSPSTVSIVNVSKHAELLVKLYPQNLISHSVVITRKFELETFFKKLMQSGRTNIEKWMLEKGLFGVNRYCLFHPKVQMKLMFMSCTGETGKRSGYKWWCPNCAIMVPVNQGSFFSKWRQDYCAVLRLIFHWSCNSDAKVVLQEAVANGEFVHSVYLALRSVCSMNVNSWKLGGQGHPVEIAELNMGACKNAIDCVLYCAYDRLTRQVKLGAVSESSTRKSKLVALLWDFIEKNSYILGDRRIVPLLPPHFQGNFVCSSNTQVNLNAISYLRDHALPAVHPFKNDLRLDSIHSLLNELAWREKFGRDPLQTFNNVLVHIKQAFVSSVVTTQSAYSVPITMASGLKVIDTARLAENVSKTTVVAKSADSFISAQITSIAEPAKASSEEQEDQEEEEEEDNGAPAETVDDAASLVVDSQRSSGASMKRNTIDQVMDKLGKEAKKLKVNPTCNVIRVSPHIPPIRVPLESYYYASKDGVESIVQKEEKGKFKFRCQACKKAIEDNVKMMKHLHGHINALKQFNLDLSDLTHCKYCFREFASPYAMQSHVEEVHVNEPVAPVCRICDKEFADSTLLLHHMKGSHTESEMPYKCAVCKYRTSFYRDILNHFQQTHDRTDKLMCNYCLQIFNVRFGVGNQEGQTYTFYRHLYKHQSKTHNRRCPTCCLAFLCNSELRQHRIDDHCGFHNKKGVKPVPVSSKSKPIYIIHKEAAGKPLTKEHIYFCIECKMPVHQQNHFLNYFGCSLCSYATCCCRAFMDHAASVHSNPSPRLPRPFRSVIPEIACVCGFMIRDGDEMAKHLVRCDNKWCYFTGDDYEDCDSPAATREKSGAGVEGLENSEGELEEDLEIDGCIASPLYNDDQHNMLNVLGLMRVNPRRRLTSSKSSSVRRSTSSDAST